MPASSKTAEAIKHAIEAAERHCCEDIANRLRSILGKLNDPHKGIAVAGDYDRP